MNLIFLFNTCNQDLRWLTFFATLTAIFPGKFADAYVYAVENQLKKERTKTNHRNNGEKCENDDEPNSLVSLRAV